MGRSGIRGEPINSGTIKNNQSQSGTSGVIHVVLNPNLRGHFNGNFNLFGSETFFNVQTKTWLPENGFAYLVQYFSIVLLLMALFGRNDFTIEFQSHIEELHPIFLLFKTLNSLICVHLFIKKFYRNNSNLSWSILAITLGTTEELPADEKTNNFCSNCGIWQFRHFKDSISVSLIYNCQFITKIGIYYFQLFLLDSDMFVVATSMRKQSQSIWTISNPTGRSGAKVKDISTIYSASSSELQFMIIKSDTNEVTMSYKLVISTPCKHFSLNDLPLLI